jgi:hypothetical protein
VREEKRWPLPSAVGNAAISSPAGAPFVVPARGVGWSTGASAACEQRWRRHPRCIGSHDRGRSRTERARLRSGRRTGGRRIPVPSMRCPWPLLSPSRRSRVPARSCRSGGSVLLSLVSAMKLSRAAPQDVVPRLAGKRTTAGVKQTTMGTRAGASRSPPAESENCVEC